VTRSRAAGATVVALALALVAACDDSNTRSHVYAGRQLEDARGCLDPTSSIDVVEGPEPPSTCSPTCIVSPPDFDSGLTTVYVSTMCPPLPAAPFDTTGSDPRCSTALAAYQANTTCLSDGGVGVPH
jgi:hypothetical protein